MMNEKIEVPIQDVYQRSSQTKNILEIAGQQITGKQDMEETQISGVNDTDQEETQISGVNDTDQEEQHVFTEDSLDTKTILQIVENLCTRLVHNGEDYIIVTTNPYKQSSDYIGSERGREFIKQNLQLLQDFVKHCYNSAFSSQLNKHKENQSTNVIASCEDLNVSNHLRDVGTPDVQNDGHGYDSDKTENYEIERNVEDAEIKGETVCKKIASVKEEVNTLKSPQEVKEYPHPKKRLKGISKEYSKDKTQINSTKKCNDCDDSFPSLSLLIKHKRNSHNTAFTCSICQKHFTSKSVLETHLKTHSSDDTKGKKKCNVCNKGFQSKNALDRHMCSHRTQTRYQCEHCSKIFWHAESYKSHLIFHEQPQHTCTDCDSKFYLKRSLSKHRELHKKQFKCKSCSAVFTDKENYELHNCERDDPSNFTQTYNSRVTEDGKHQCGICEKVFKKRRGLLTHRKLHSTVYTADHVCEICNKCYRTRNSLKKHMKVVHSDSRDFVCEACGKTFKQQDTLNAHMRVHESNRTEFQCKECGKYLSAQAALNVHLRVHQKLKPYICDVCGVSFSQRGNLAKHMTSHSDSTNFSCKLCGKEFKYHETWKTHMRSHALKAGLKDLEVSAYGKFYVCEICQKKVASASQYKVHMRTHTNERPYECLQCGKCFKESGKLSRHMRTHKPVSHQEHNYTWDSNDNEGNVKNTTQYVNIAMKPDINSSQVLAHDAEGNVLVSDRSIDSVDHNVGYTANMAYSDNMSRDTNTVLVKPTNSITTNTDHMRVIDDSRHQFLMHQLAPVTNLIMESPDGRQIQVPSSSSVDEVHVMQVGFVEECQVTSENHLNHPGYSVPNPDMMPGNQSNNSFPYNKYFHRD